MGTQDLSNSQLDALKDIFGDAAGGGAYSGQQVGRLEGGTNGVEAIIQVVKNEEGYVAPDDYQTTAPSSQMVAASLTSGMASASSALRTPSALGSLMSAALTLTSSPLPLPQL